jgi:2-keto-4-pentenoate hydratase/2-oxohepta-3-ene-1,7-dioic acid hydratase in catechol pathway
MAIEPMIDEAARELKLDRLAIRRINAPDNDGFEGHDGKGKLTSAYLKDALAKGGELFNWEEKKKLSGQRNGSKVIGVGRNYAAHAREAKLETPKVPTIFAKFPTAVIGPGEKVVLPKASAKPDYEAEFAFVIGQGGRYVPADRWRDHVFGYTCFNDVSSRDFQMATSQWIIGKTFDTFAPFGPAIVTADEIEDPHCLDISLNLSGDVMQRSNTRELIFGIPQLIAYLSSVFTLQPGDVVATGTPAGVGFARKPPRWLKPGDEVTVSISGIGDLVNPVIAEP